MKVACPPRRLDRPDGLAAPLRIAGADHYLGALGGTALHDRPPDTVGAARDHRHLAVEQAHSYWASNPASTDIAWPCTNAASSVQSQATTSATSAAVP